MQKRNQYRRFNLWIAGLILLVSVVIALLFLYTARIQQTIIHSHRLTNEVHHQWLYFKESIFTAAYSDSDIETRQDAYQHFAAAMERLRAGQQYRSYLNDSTTLGLSAAALEIKWQAISGQLRELTFANGKAANQTLIEMLQSEQGASFNTSVIAVEELAYAKTSDQLYQLRILSYAVLIFMVLFVLGFLSFLLAGRERFQSEQRIRRLTQSLLQQIEDERQQVNFDLHEVLIQDLTSAKMKCQNMREELRVGAAVSNTQMDSIIEELREVIRVAKGITSSLKPRRLDHFGLAGGIRALCDDLSAQTNTDIRFQAVGLEAVSVEYQTEINLYRIAQDLLRYIKRWSKASRISVRLIASSPNLYLRLHDNGRGENPFNKGEPPFKKRSPSADDDQEQLRLLAVEERVRMLNGVLSVSSHPEKGTEYKVAIPLPRQSLADN